MKEKKDMRRKYANKAKQILTTPIKKNSIAVLKL